MQAAIAEREIHRIWQRHGLDHEELATGDGQPVQIVHPGHANDGGGPDFKNAVILFGPVMLKGDVEIHASAQGWYEHGHHRDPAYNRVILHVVLHHEGGPPAMMANGGEAPTLAISAHINATVKSRYGNGLNTAPIPCRKAARTVQETGTALDEAGEARFRQKAERLREEAGRAGAGQALYAAVMTALGYSRNKLAFRELAGRLPLDAMENTAASLPDADWLVSRHTLLLAASGLTDTERRIRTNRTPGSRMESIENVIPLPPEIWYSGRIRPNNSPFLRLRALSHLLLRHRRPGLLKGLLNLVEETAADREGLKRMTSGLIVSENGVTLLGKERAAAIIVNVLLPFASVFGKGSEDRALYLYRIHQRLEDNAVDREMKARIGLDSKTVNTARRQQGLIHIYRNRCCQGNCRECKLSQLQPGHHI